MERNNLDNEIDNENTDELLKLRSEIAVQTEAELREVSENLRMKTQQDGIWLLFVVSVAFQNLKCIVVLSYTIHLNGI